MKRLFVVFLALALVGLAPALAQSGACSTATIRGSYAVVCTGYMSPAAGASQVPFTMMGSAVADWSGNITGGGKASIGGNVVASTVSGTAVLNSDCTGTVHYDQKINGQPGPPMNLVFHVLNDGQEMRGMSVDAGSNITCSLRLISR